MATRERIGTKRLVVGAHYGARDFIVQRVTAVIMAVYTIVVCLILVFTSNLDFDSWRHLFSFRVIGFPLGQTLASLAFLSLAWHAWVGARDIWMDYVKPTGLRLLFHAVSALWVVGSAIYFLKTLWSL